jgi:lipid-binding SYLF domain-containing protein
MPVTRRAAALALAATLVAPAAFAASARAIDTKVDLALDELRRVEPAAAELLDTAKGVLVMPDVIKGGLIIGGAFGEGALRVDGRTVGYYRLASGSFGLQAGVKSAKQALFFMTDEALARFRRSEGWEFGADAALVAPGQGLSAAISSTTQNAPVIAVTFGEDGLMAGASLEGARYMRVTR